MLKKIIVLILVSLLAISCGNNEDSGIEDDQLGFIDADVTSEETSFKSRAEYYSGKPGDGNKLNRSFENAPPLIPHTTAGFFPIKIKNNICFSCHLPENAKEVNAIPLPKTHFVNLREQLILVDGVYQKPDESKVVVEELEKFNNAYFNCSQCHVPQTEVSVEIENLFTPQFRKEFGIDSSNLIDKIDEGI